MSKNLQCRMSLSLPLALAMCVALRTAAPAEQPAQATPAAKAPAKIDPAGGCITAECHAAVSSRSFHHGPVNLNQCQPCHIPQGDRHQFEKMPEGKDLCLTCHEPEKAKRVVHAPFATNCLMCHDPHGGENSKFLIGGASVETCDRCHTDVRQGLAFTHGPVSLGECVVCHSPHQSDHDKLLVAPTPDLCTSCHVDFGEKLKGAVSTHKPAQDSCFQCHSPHGGANRFFLPAEGRELCNKCHGDFLKEMEKAKYPHAPMTQGKACQNCHSPHFSNQEHLLSEKTMDLCFGCHKEQIVTGNRTIKNVKAEAETSKFLHGPIREGNCVACHAAHGSNYTDILDKEFPRDFYASYKEGAYDLCFQCHDRNIVQDAKSTTTNFRNGVVNLHYLHVNREKGRTCRACHDEHASNQPKHIREEVPFGKWTMKLKFTIADTGGGCATGCHVPYRYDRVNPVENLKPTPIAPAPPTSTEQPAATSAPPASSTSSDGAAK